MVLNKKPRITAYLNMFYKNAPKGYVGPTQEGWSIGTDEPMELNEMLSGAMFVVINFYQKIYEMDDEQIYEELEKVKKIFTRKEEQADDNLRVG